jgi:two-component system NarL family response regulator
VLVVDDHPVVREGLVALLGRQDDLVVAGETGDGEEAVEIFRRERPDVVLMDLRLPRMSGVEAITAIRHEFPEARILVLTTYDGEEDIYRALHAGARGYLLKASPRGELLAAIRAVAGGQRWIPPEVAERLAGRVAGAELTPRELAVLHEIVNGKSNKRIGAALGVTEGTVKTHVNNILSKLGVADRTEAAIAAIQRGLVRPR